MVSLQIISKVILSGDISIIEDNQLGVEYFVGYEEEYNFIVDHYKEFGNVPDRETFLSHFVDDKGNPTIDLVEVNESDRYLLETIQEEYLFYKLVPVVQKIADLSNQDSNAAVEYMLQATKELKPNYNLGGIDIIKEAKQRYDEFVERKEHQDDWFFTTGFPELDNMIHGIKREEELLVIFARTNQGKSWVLEKMCAHVWEIGFNVGYISPEMGASSIGYRFDTLYGNIDNKALMWGNNNVKNEDYKDYINKLAEKNNRFIVATPNDFDRRITVAKLRNWVKKYELNLIAIDGITYLTDERAKNRDNKTTSLTNISEDLMSLSMELRVPVLVVVQANRGGIVDNNTEDLPDLESIRDSDGIAHNASIVLALRQMKDNVLLIQSKKQRIGSVGGKVAYAWNPNIGEFIYTQTDESIPMRKKERTTKKKEVDKEDVF